MRRPRTLRGRLSLFYAVVLALVLIAYSGAVFYVAIFEEEEAEEREGRDELISGGRRVLLTLSFGLPIAMGVAVGGGLWAARRTLSPLGEVVRIAGELGVGSLERRIPRRDEAGEEVAEVISALNGMLARVERSVGVMRRFTADASHELRTPIAVLMGNIEVALRRSRSADELRATLEGTLEEMGRLSHLLDALLTLARSDAGELTLTVSEVDLGELVRRVVDPYDVIAAERGIALLTDCGPGILVLADPLWLGRALANLVDNACKFTPRGGRVALSVEHDRETERTGSLARSSSSSAGSYSSSASTQPGPGEAATSGEAGSTVQRPPARVRLSVTDTGPGLTGEERERAFERFYRGAAVRGSSEGFGLGLPLAREIICALGGELHIESAVGGGARFIVALPVAGSLAD